MEGLQSECETWIATHRRIERVQLLLNKESARDNDTALEQDTQIAISIERSYQGCYAASAVVGTPAPPDAALSPSQTVLAVKDRMYYSSLARTSSSSRIRCCFFSSFSLLRSSLRRFSSSCFARRCSFSSRTFAIRPSTSYSQVLPACKQRWMKVGLFVRCDVSDQQFSVQAKIIPLWQRVATELWGVPPPSFG